MCSTGRAEGDAGNEDFLELDLDDDRLRPHPRTAMDRFAARKAIVAELEAQPATSDKIEPHRHAVPHGDRSGVPIEPLLTVQWYCNAAELAKPAIAAVETGATCSSSPANGRTPSSPGCATSSPGASAASSGGATSIPAWYGPDGTVFVAHRKARPRPRREAHYGTPHPPGTRPGRPRHLVQLRALAVLHPRLARTTRPSSPVTTRATSWSPGSTSSSSGSPA